MKKFLLSLLVIVLALGLLGAVAYAGYRYGFTQGMAAASNGDSRFLGPGLGMGPNRMPMHEFGFNRGFDRDGFVLMNRGFGFGFFPLLGILLQLLVLGLIIWGIYVLIKRSGWRLARTATATTPAVEPIPPASTEEDQRS